MTIINVIAILLGVIYNGLGCDYSALGKYWYISIAETTMQSLIILYFAVKNIKLIRKFSENLLKNENEIVRQT